MTLSKPAIVTAKYVLDSCIWIKMGRGDQKILSLVTPWVQEEKVAIVDLIMAEVLRGVPSKKDFNNLKRDFLAFPQIKTSWQKVAELAYKVRKKGFHPPLADLYIAQAVIDYKMTLVTQDRDFAQIVKAKKFILKML